MTPTRILLVTPNFENNSLGRTYCLCLLAKELGCQITERRVSGQEWLDGAADGTITEVFGCGTAAVITPIGVLKARDFTVGSLEAPAGALTMSLREELTGIQYGRVEDHHRWMHRLA